MCVSWSFKTLRMAMAENGGWLMNVVKQSACFSAGVMDKPKFPQYADILKRKESFGKCPYNLPVSINDLVEAGLVFTGVGDCVRCYHCGVRLKDWEAGDVPMEEHAKWHPRCSYVLRVMGPSYVESVGRGEKPDLEMNSLAPQSQETIHEDVLMHTIAVQSCLEMGFSKELVRSAVRLFIACHGHTNFKGHELAQLCFDIEEEPSLVDTALKRNCCDTEASIVDHMLKSENLAAADDDESEMQFIEENQRMKNILTCKKCMINMNAVVLFPCRHFCCHSCAPAVCGKKCHCGSYICYKVPAKLTEQLDA